MDMFKKRGDHIIGSFIGASFLGVILGQLPGAFIGGAIGLIYAIASLPKAENNEAEQEL